MDNWLYSTVNAFRVAVDAERRAARADRVERRAMGHDAGQRRQGVVPGRRQRHAGVLPVPGPVYGNFNYPEQFEPDLQIAWGAPVRIADMQGGMPSVRMPDGSLNRVTGAAGSDVFRGHRMPPDLVGDYIYGEPVARIVRRFRPVVTEGLTQLRNVYTWNEFIKSTDPLFRPVEMATAPDGTLYITDMYRGIIQQATWSGPGTYLRARIDQYGLDDVHSHGRIWRLTYDGMPRDRTVPRMLNETPAQLVAHLSHANGWWRDTAQQLLVLKQDKSVVPAFRRSCASPSNLLGRFHGLWTLEGLGALDAGARAAADEGHESADAHPGDPRQRVAVQVGRSFVRRGLPRAGQGSERGRRHPVADDDEHAEGRERDRDDSSRAGRQQSARRAARRQRHHQPGVERRSRRRWRARLPPPLPPAEAAVVERGQVIYNELCFSCHGTDGRGEPRSGAPAGTTMAPSLVGSPRVLGHRDYIINAILHGLTGPIDGESFVEVMVPMGSNQDEWVASVASFVRKSFGNNASLVSTADVQRVRAATTNRTTMWTVADLERAIPRLLPSQPTWKVSASHNTERAASALTFQGWSTAAPQQAGMWLQVELPAAVSLAEVQFTAAGGGRRGGAPVVVAPKAYQVQISTDGQTWSTAAEGPGTETTTLTFKPVQARFVRVVQTAGAENAAPWAVQALRLYQQ